MTRHYSPGIYLPIKNIPSSMPAHQRYIQHQHRRRLQTSVKSRPPKAPIAQLDRVAASEAVGRRFDSCWVRQLFWLRFGVPAIRITHGARSRTKHAFKNAQLALLGAPFSTAQSSLFGIQSS